MEKRTLENWYSQQNYLRWFPHVKLINADLMFKEVLANQSDDPLEYVEVFYTDGGRKEQQTKAGYVTSTGKNRIEHIVGSSQQAEKYAIKMAFQDSGPQVNIITDSKYCFSILRARPNPETIENSLWKDIISLVMKKDNWYIGWIPGHKGVPGNTEADQLVSIVVEGENIKDKRPEDVGYDLCTPKDLFVLPREIIKLNIETKIEIPGAHSDRQRAGAACVRFGHCVEGTCGWSVVCCRCDADTSWLLVARTTRPGGQSVVGYNILHNIS